LAFSWSPTVRRLNDPHSLHTRRLQSTQTRPIPSANLFVKQSRHNRRSACFTVSSITVIVVVVVVIIIIHHHHPSSSSSSSSSSHRASLLLRLCLSPPPLFPLPSPPAPPPPLILLPLSPLLPFLFLFFSFFFYPSPTSLLLLFFSYFSCSFPLSPSCSFFSPSPPPTRSFSHFLLILFHLLPLLLLLGNVLVRDQPVSLVLSARPVVELAPRSTTLPAEVCYTNSHISVSK